MHVEIQTVTKLLLTVTNCYFLVTSLSDAAVYRTNSFFQAWEYRITHPWFLSKTLFRFSSLYHVHERCQKVVKEFTDEIITKKLDELSQNAGNAKRSETDGGEDEDFGRKTKTVIEILLENYHEMSHEQIRYELVTIMIGKYTRFNLNYLF